jgi:CheY-like chemotaxis protein
MRAQLSALNESDDPGHRQEVLAEFYVGLHALTSEAERTGLKVAHQLASAIGKVVHKLIEKPGLFTPSALQAAATALHLLEELSAAGAEPDLGHPGVRVLVVDDDPVARRAISSALQLTLGRPEIAESGEAALLLAETRTFDVIFLDVIMPGMDGFATCSKIRETNLNFATPVVFVTGQSDAESREKSVRFGGNGFITKPVLPAEIFLTALTFALRARMDEFAPA